MLAKFIFFSLVGVLGTAAHYLVLYLLVEFRGYDPVWASGVGSVAGLLVNYVLNFKLTFRSQQSHTQAFPKFALIALCGMGFNLLLMHWLTPWLFYFYAQVITTALILLWNFFINFFWTFKMDRPPMSPSATRKNRLSLGTGLLVVVVWIRLITLGFYPLYDPSEARYAEMARKMLETGNWVTPMIEYGVPFWGKPPLTIWLSAFSLQLGGINEFFVRLPSLLAGLASIWIFYQLVKVQRDKSQAIFSALVLFSSTLFFVISGTVAMDQCLSFGTTLALSAFWLALRGEQRYWGYVFFVGLSIGLMAKGPIALVLTGVTIGLWTLITGRWPDIWKAIPWISGTVLMLCLCVPWYLLAEQRTPGFLEYFFIGEHWKRFTESGWKGDLYGVGRAHPRGMIWLYWLGAGFPWTLVLLKKLVDQRKNLVALFKSADNWRLYCWLWMLSPLLFFSVSANVIWTYVLPGLPGLALLVAEDSQPGKKMQFVSLCAPLLVLGAVIAYQFPQQDFFRSQKRLVDAYQQVAKADEQLIYMNEKTYSIQFYLHGKAICLSDMDALHKSLADPASHFYVLRKAVSETLPASQLAQLKPVQSYGEFTLFHYIPGGS